MTPTIPEPAWRQVAESLDEFGRRTASAEPSLEAVTAIAVQAVRGARWASITSRRGSSWRIEATTGEPALRADLLQHELGGGPCLDAVTQWTVVRSGDVRSDARWPDFGPRVAGELGLNSVLSCRLGLGLALEAGDQLGGLNVYSDELYAFDDESVAVALLVATSAALAVTLAAERARTRNLHVALESSRDIGVATGLLMSEHRISRARAFDLLRLVSQHTNRKVRDVAGEVAGAGAVAVPATLARRLLRT